MKNRKNVNRKKERVNKAKNRNERLRQQSDKRAVNGALTKKQSLLKPSLEIFIIFILSITVYSNTLNHGFVLDDMMMITHNRFTHEGIDGMGKILTNDAFTGFHGEDKNLLPGGRYRPLSHLMFALEFELFGDNPLPGHLINIILYSLACIILYKALTLLFLNFPFRLWRFSLPFVITLLFALHPLHTESVANIKGRDEILGLIGFASIAYLSLKYALKSNPKYLAAIVPIFFLSLLSKESSLTYIAAMPLLVLFLKQRFNKYMLHITLSMFAGLTLYMALRIGAIGFPKGDVSSMELLNDPFLYATFPERIATLLYTWIKYIRLIFFPHPLTHDYYPWHITYMSFTNLWVWISMLFFFGFGIYSIKVLKKPDMPALGFLLFIILFSSQSNLLVNIGAFMNERFVFIALLGILIIICWILLKIIPEKISNGNKVAFAIFILIVLGFSAKTMQRNMAWKDDFTLFTTDVKVSENSAKVNVSAGGQYYERAVAMDDEVEKRRLLRQALPYIKKGTELHPRYWQGQLLLGNTYMLLDKFKESFEAYRACLKINPNMAEAMENTRSLASRASMFKDYEALERIYGGLLQFHPDERDFVIGYAEALMYNLRTDRAFRILDSIHSIDSENARVNHLLGQIWGRYKASEPGLELQTHISYLHKAKEHLEKAVDIKPENYGMIENLAIVNGMTGNYGKALILFNDALDMMLEKRDRLNGDAAIIRVHDENIYRIYRNIGDTYRSMNNANGLFENYLKAFEYNQDDRHIVITIGEFSKPLGRTEVGVNVLEKYLRRNPTDQQVTEILKKLR